MSPSSSPSSKEPSTRPSELLIKQSSNSPSTITTFTKSHYPTTELLTQDPTSQEDVTNRTVTLTESKMSTGEVTGKTIMLGLLLMLAGLVIVLSVGFAIVLLYFLYASKKRKQVGVVIVPEIKDSNSGDDLPTGGYNSLG
eukprot:CAMPEP_0194187308 /NCGR_PEP_ID=MMETSP0154-20130528/50290_1 /TAXON_ID=1049557 /ORGANISM="Thalassiothrix antarctica, Strain L6-D1" /LENGTH=139 /DNA_ID=CAMNT_0038906919 /DNA_START=8 /DNA_END=423 /DNA_ORIENTATION=-